MEKKFSWLTEEGLLVESENIEDIRGENVHSFTVHETLTAEECRERYPEAFAKFETSNP